MTAPLEVACAVEGDYAFHSAAMIRSVLRNRGALPVRFNYLHGPELPSDVVRGLGEMVGREDGCSISFVTVDDARCEGLPTVGFTKKATWYRIFLPELLPEVDRVLSLDVDLLVVDELGPLWATDLGGSYLGAVTNLLAPMYMSRPAELGLDPRDYFNAGVMLLDLEQMRADGCSERIRLYSVEHSSELVLRDQDALNFVLAGRRHALHPRWNSMNSLRVYPWAPYAFTPAEIAAARATPAIRHFEGPAENKPWNLHCDEESQALYRSHRLQTPWPEYNPEGRPALVEGARGLRNRLQKATGLRGDSFPALRRLAAKRGYHLVRGDFYSPVPDDWPAEHWDNPAPMPGVDVELETAAALLKELAPFIVEYGVPNPPRETKHGYRADNSFYPQVDAEILYATLRARRPGRLVEIGAGWSSRVVADALEVNGAEDAATREHRIFDPFPADHLRSLGADVEAVPAERIPDSVFETLDRGDVLFIDTTHTVRPGNDVVRLLLEVVPQLAAGVHVHVHDIFLPYCYPRFLFDAGYHWQEQYLLQALLVGNPVLRVMMPTYALFRERSDAVEAAVPGMASRTLGSGFWLETV